MLSKDSDYLEGLDQDDLVRIIYTLLRRAGGSATIELDEQRQLDEVPVYFTVHRGLDRALTFEAVRDPVISAPATEPGTREARKTLQRPPPPPPPRG